MNKRFGGKKPTGTPSLALSTVVVVASLLAGASVVHNLYKPDLTLPQMGSDELIHWACVVDAMVCGKGRYTLVKDVDDVENGAYDKPLPCFGCGIGWFSFLLGFVFPLLWYYATFLYFGNYYRKDPRERAGLAASAITAMGFSLLLLVIAVFRWF
ncbi:hypothetical protein F2Q70_00039707 [Brassica cretica]|uniref:Uncharacterized protein n=1 Tax=Brassica cretica TaxID=69181 RepID=A0A8S9KDV5_BRACR|nr:hypothetical protein F2Q70_00039707 [Brassica cretica]